MIPYLTKIYFFLLAAQLYLLPIQAQRQPVFNIPDTTVPSRIWLMGGVTASLYGGALLALNDAWYRQYPRTGFHFFNDDGEWAQMDKMGHIYSAYMEGKMSRELWRYTGLPRKQQIWIGGLSGFTYQSVIEVLDAYSSEWGFSWGDMTANAAGAALMISQELAWDEQRIQLKFSSFPQHYRDPVIKARSNELFGKSLPERTLKDYNAQTYWLSINLHSFAPDSHLPAWLNIAVGYGADGMFKGDNNIWVDDNGVKHNYNDIPRIRQFYLAPDIDFTKIPTRRKGLKALFVVLNMLKFPAPTLEVTSQGKLKGHLIYF
ncbi:Predicted lipoprotein [Chitinophaga sp. CF118]|uniref:DUF2279 domain-containing protein n=1 Tax=Chitinophaga sp. CF118 TaxID=1884367 RepID=UPI0008E64BBA|nr:DUF2279 domain-containing protein [Chitinophaga sp. CF118]SFD63460.1 Predicted lipoprotein [Chitinophaga sp. CF118]